MIQSMHKGLTVTISELNCEHTDKSDVIRATETAISLLQESLLNYTDDHLYEVETALIRLARQALKLHSFSTHSDCSAEDF